MRRLFLRLEVLLLVVVAFCLAVLSGGQKPSRAAQLELASGPGGSLTLSNDKEGAAILSLGGMRPGDSATSTVTLGNTGTLDGDLSLSTSNLVDTPGSGGGALSAELDLRIRDVTSPGTPSTVYDGKLDALTPTTLGTLAAGDSRVYEFRASFPDAGPGAENAYQGSAMSIQFDWTAVNNSPDLDPPETTITSGPSGLTASSDTTFTFTADESGSTFECSLDGGGFSSCTSPATLNGLADGAHTFDVRATDSAANTDATPDSGSWTVDTTAPNVLLADPGSPLRGTVALNPWADDGGGSGVATLVVQRSPAGAGAWATIGTNWDTTGLVDGSYDLRARATDNAGNVANSALRTVIVDNGVPTKPKGFSGAKENARLVLRWKAATDNGGDVSAYLIYAKGLAVRTLAASARSVDMGRFKTSDSRYLQVAARDAADNIGPKTRALVIVPALAKLTIAQARSRLTARGLRTGTLRYAYSSSIRAGLVISARSGVVVFKGTAVGLTVSRGPAPRTETFPFSGAGGGSTDSGGTSYPSSTYGGGTSTPSSSSGGTIGGTPLYPATGSEGSDSSPGSGGVEPESFTPSDDDGSPLRRLLGLTLLGGAFLAAGAVALRARRPRLPRGTAGPGGVEPLLFWDQRLFHAVSQSVRRVMGRL
jgi:PASTA domain